MKRTARAELVAVAWLVLAAAIACTPTRQLGAADLPQCPEDTVIVGTGDYHAGRWTAYECGPAVDDYDPAR